MFSNFIFSWPIVNFLCVVNPTAYFFYMSGSMVAALSFFGFLASGVYILFGIVECNTFKDPIRFLSSNKKYFILMFIFFIIFTTLLIIKYSLNINGDMFLAG